MNNSFYKKSTLSRLKSVPLVFRLKQGLAKANPYGQGSKHNMTYRMPSVDEIYDAETNKNRKIQYVLGEETIFAKEQSDNPVLADIIFVNGALIVSPQQVNLLRYLEMSNYNESNPNKMPGKVAIFYKVDIESDTKDTVEDMEVEADALYMARSMEPQKLVGYARTLGINVDRSMYEIKHDMMVMAKGNPQLFMDEISNPMIERKQIIMDAVENEVVTYAQGKRQYLWSDNKQIIYTVAVGLEPLDALTEFTFEDEGTPVFSRIKRLLSGGKEEKVEEVKKMPKKMVKTD